MSDKGFILKLLTYSNLSLEEIDLAILSKEELNAYLGFKSIKRKLEFFFTRVLWKDFGMKERIFYNEFGRPFLPDAHISISHSRNVIVIAYNKNDQIGIDVEYKSPKISLIKDKFLSQEDARLIDSTNKTHLTLVWSIKEAVYKMENIPGLSFKEHIHVTIKDHLGYVNVNKQEETHSYTFQFIERDLYVITFCSFHHLRSKNSNLRTLPKN
jgi:4'-phosphopantetheinyl transferase EntD